MHSLVSCQFARECWAILLPDTQFYETECFMTWLKHMFSTVGKGKYAEIITLCWSLWRSRNDLIWNQKSRRFTEQLQSQGSTLYNGV